jgi:hypothetical protein
MIADHALDWMYEDPTPAHQRHYVRRLVREVMDLQAIILGFLEAWDADPANVAQMDAAIRTAREAIGQTEPTKS